MDVIVLVLSGLVLIATIAIPPIGIILERKGYNNGCCPECGTKLRLFDTDSQGGRGYCCDNCDYHTWVSWDTVDKNYSN